MREKKGRDREKRGNKPVPTTTTDKIYTYNTKSYKKKEEDLIIVTTNNRHIQ